MQRALVIGCSGAGKSVFAQRLGQMSGLPVIHLDKVYWRAGWQEPDSAEWRKSVSGLVAEPRWIMDGNYGGTLDMRLQYADTVFFFDTPRWHNLKGVLGRTLRGYGHTRPDLAEGCPERFDWVFLSYVWRFNQVHRPRTIASLASYQGDLITLRSRAAANVYLDGLRAPLAP